RPNAALPEVYVVSRAHLDHDAEDDQRLEALSLCPPAPGEKLTTTLPRFKRWISAPAIGSDSQVYVQDDLSDLEGRAATTGENERVETVQPRPFIIWRGQKESRTGSMDDLRPGDVVVVPASYGASQLLGHVETDSGSVRDIA